MIALLMAGAFVIDAAAQVPSSTADQIKAAYLQKFAGYVDWPPQAFADVTSPFVIGIVGASGVHAELARVAGERPVQGRALEVIRLTPTDSPKNIQILFVGRDVENQAAVALLASYRGRPVLTVSDAARGLDAGAALNLVQKDNRVRFEASPAAAEQSGLRMSSRLLAVADRVQGTR